MTRLSKKSYSDLSKEQQEVFDRLKVGRNVTDGHIGGPFDPWLLNAEMGSRITGLGGMFRARTSVDRRYIELAILVTGAHWRAQYEWWAHEPMAREAGVPDDVIRAILEGRKPDCEDPGDAAAFQLINELLLTKHCSDAVYRAAIQQFGEQGVSELVNVSGYYTMVSMTLNAFDVPLPEGAEYPFPEGNR